MINLLEMNKICKKYEKLSLVEYTTLITTCSAKVLLKLKELNLPGIDPITTYVSFVIGAVVADGTINEKEYLLIYPSLIRAFGDDFDYMSIKESFKKDKEGKQKLKEVNKDMLTICGMLDEDLKKDILVLSLCVLSVDGKISLKEKRYLRHLL